MTLKTPLHPSEEASWRPTWWWHVKTLLVIYVLLTVVFFVVDRFLSRLPEPHRLRDVPPEMTPWLKK